MVWGTDVLVTVVGTAGVSQTEVRRQLGHDPGGRDFTVDGVGDDRGAQSHHGSGLHRPVGELRTGLVLQELDAVIGVQETGDADDVSGIGFGNTFLNFLSSPTGVADAGAQSTVGDVTGAEEVLNSEEVVIHTAPPVFQRTGRLVQAPAGTARAAREAPASGPAARREVRRRV